MRLIDVTDLEKFIRENVCVIGDDHLLLVAGDDGRWHEALPLVKTSYDVDKVVEQMEDATAIGADCVGNAFECIPKYMAIEIVKAGGKIYGKVD